MRRSFLFVLSQSVNESNCQSVSRLMFLSLKMWIFNSWENTFTIWFGNDGHKSSRHLKTINPSVVGLNVSFLVAIQLSSFKLLFLVNKLS